MVTLATPRARYAAGRGHMLTVNAMDRVQFRDLSRYGSTATLRMQEGRRYDGNAVMFQLRASGILDCVRIRCDGAHGTAMDTATEAGDRPDRRGVGVGVGGGGCGGGRYALRPRSQDTGVCVSQ